MEKQKKTPPRAKQTFKNVIKNLVKENQRIHDYKSKFGVKFWNKILYDSKFYAKNHKVFDENVHKVVERDYQYYQKRLKEETDPTQIEILKEKIFQLEPFIDGRWKEMIDPYARLYPKFRKMLYLVRKGKVEYGTKEHLFEKESQD